MGDHKRNPNLKALPSNNGGGRTVTGTLPEECLPELRELYKLAQQHQQAYNHRLAVNLACKGHDTKRVTLQKLDLDSGDYALNDPTQQDEGA